MRYEWPRPHSRMLISSYHRGRIKSRREPLGRSAACHDGHQGLPYFASRRIRHGKILACDDWSQSMDADACCWRSISTPFPLAKIDDGFSATRPIDAHGLYRCNATPPTIFLIPMDGTCLTQEFSRRCPPLLPTESSCLNILSNADITTAKRGLIMHSSAFTRRADIIRSCRVTR